MTSDNIWQDDITTDNWQPKLMTTTADNILMTQQLGGYDILTPQNDDWQPTTED